MPSVTVDYYGVPGTGRTVTEAKKDAGRKIEKALAFRPRVYSYRGWSVAISYEPDGASYILIHPDRDGRQDSTCFTNQDDVVWHALHHLFQIARKDGEYEVPDWVPLPKDQVKRLVADWYSDDGFQRAFRHIKAEHPDWDSNQCHRWGCDHHHEFETKEQPCPPTN